MKEETSTAAELERIWELDVEGMVKHFLWKAGQNLVPTKMNLGKKNIIENDLYPICEREPESSVRDLSSCPAASDIWSETGSLVQKRSNNQISSMDLWNKLYKSLKFENVESLAFTMRRI